MNDNADTSPRKRKRRWFQVSLRAMFVVVTLAALGCGYVAREWRIVSERRATMAQLRSSHSHVSVLYEDYSGREHAQGPFGENVMFISTDGTEPADRYISPTNSDGPSWLRKLLGDVNVKYVECGAKMRTAEVHQLAERFPEATICHLSP